MMSATVTYSSFFCPKFLHFMLNCMTCGFNKTVSHATRHALQWTYWEPSSINILFHVRERSIRRLYGAIYRLYTIFCGPMLKLMSIQISTLELTRMKTTLKHLFMRYRPKYWKEYAKIGLSGWTIWDAVAVNICMK